MKKILAVAALSFAAMGAQAAPVIMDVSWTSSFPNSVIDYSGTWSTQLGNGVDVFKLQETCLQGQETTIAPPGDASKVCGRDKDWTNRNGVEGDWITGQDQSGAADARFFTNLTLSEDESTLTFSRSLMFVDDPASFFFAQTCVGGGCQTQELIFTRIGATNQYELSSFEQCVPFGCLEADTFSGIATIVPVPAAVWLFASALGLMGWIRRRATV